MYGDEASFWLDGTLHRARSSDGFSAQRWHKYMRDGCGYAEIFEILRAMSFPSGRFRAVALEVYRPGLAIVRAETWGLPLDFQSVLADDGSDPSAAAALVRTARATVPGCAIGTVGAEQVDPLWADEITREVSVVFEFLRLGPVRVRASSD